MYIGKEEGQGKRIFTILVMLHTTQTCCVFLAQPYLDHYLTSSPTSTCRKCPTTTTFLKKEIARHCTSLIKAMHDAQTTSLSKKTAVCSHLSFHESAQYFSMSIQIIPKNSYNSRDTKMAANSVLNKMLCNPSANFPLVIFF